MKLSKSTITANKASSYAL